MGAHTFGQEGGTSPREKCKSNYILGFLQYVHTKTLLIRKAMLRNLTLAKNYEIEYLENCINRDHCVLFPYPHEKFLWASLGCPIELILQMAFY